MRVRASRPFEEYHEEQMRDPAFAAAYRALEPEFQIAREVIRLRLARGLSQEQLAQKAGTGQPNISRLERGPSTPRCTFSKRWRRPWAQKSGSSPLRPENERGQGSCLA